MTADCDLGSLLDAADLQARERAEGEALAARLLPDLRMAGTWLTRETLAHMAGVTVRDVRLAGEYSHGAIIFGQRGVRAAEQATRDELQACADALDSQAAKMKRRAADVRAYLHSGKVGA
jgi:hypothetical protein